MTENDLPEQLRIRREKRDSLLARGIEAYPVAVPRSASLSEIRERFKSLEIDRSSGVIESVAGRIIFKRDTGKLCFAMLREGDGTELQVMLSLDKVGESVLESWKADIDIGDIVSVTGEVITSKRGELSVLANSYVLASKSLRPLPNEHNPLSEETRVRMRYVDLIVRPEARDTARIRPQVLKSLRSTFDKTGFVEVETPMLQVMHGGAAARPFKTHSNAYDMELFLRIAPELFLKRCVVGGIEKVFEINRNFRNEGLSTRHNPEFTMLELYQAYADYHDLMDLVERMLRGAAEAVVGALQFSSQGRQYDLSGPFARISVEDLILRENPDLDRARLRDRDYLRAACDARGIPWKPGDGPGKLQIEIFEKTGEQTLQDPTFVYAYPAEVSPLSRANDADPFITDRFEFFVGGREIANGFSELNDAEEQAARFQAQVARKESGDDEAMFYDADYVRALEYGLPPTAGLGVGIDRLVMFLTDSPSIRDVLLFPQMRPE